MDFEVRHVDGTTVKLISSEHKCAITSATQTRKLCGNDTVTINLQSATYIEFRVGDKITIFGTTYTMNQLPTVKKESERSYTYTLVFEGLQYTLIDRVFLMPDNTQGDNLMFDLAGMLDVLDDNINRGNSGKPYEFVLDESLEETEYKNLSLTGKNCLQVLQQLCQEWDTEFVFAEEPTRIAIYIGVAGSTFAFPFKYGRGGGVYELNREKGASDICTRLFVYGGTQNLTYYRHNRLCLPSKEKNQSYVEDATAQAVYGIKEQVKNFDDIYPNRIGTITSLSGCDYNEFIDSAMADAEYGFDLNEKWANNADDCAEWLALKGLENTEANRTIYYNDVADTATKYLMADATAKIHFNTGALAGYECDLHSYTHSSQKFVLKPLVDENGYDFPSKTYAAFKLAVGDEYVILDINLPTAYKTQAESKLATEAASYFNTVCRPQPKYTLTIEPIALKHIVGPSTADTEIFKVGDLINVSDPTGGVESATIRIDQFVRNLLDPFDYKLTLTDEITYSQQVRTLIEVDAIKRVVEESKIYDVNRIRRGWKDAEELYNQMFDTEGHYYSEKIAPLSIDTQMLKVGARSQQLVLQNVLFQPNYNADPANLQISAGSLVHYTIAEPDIKTWTMSAYSGSNVPSTAQYVYAKCAKNGTTGTWLVTDEAIVFDSELYPNDYHFLVGSLSSVDSVSNTRNFAATYGFTTINGRNITTGVIKSADGNGVIIDLDRGTITGNIKFLSGGQAVDAEQYINNTVDTEISGLGLDGTNLLPIDKNKWEQGSWDDETGAHLSTTTRIRNTKGGNYIRVEAGTTYTISRHTDVGASKTYHVVLYAYNSSGNWVSADSKVSWQTTFPFTWTPTTATRLEIGIRHSDNSTITADEAGIAKIKIEKGETATAWTLSPEDVQGGIDAISNLEIGGRNLLRGTSVPKTVGMYGSNGSFLATTPLQAVNYIVSFDMTLTASFSFSWSDVLFLVYWNENITQYLITSGSYGVGTHHISVPFVPNSNFVGKKPNATFYFNTAAYAGIMTVSNIKLEQGTIATDWTPAPEDTDYLRNALNEATSGSTEINGGLILTKMIQAGSGSTQAGLAGLANSLVALWAGANLSQAADGNAPIVIWRDGNAKFGAVRINGMGSGELVMIGSDGSPRLQIKNDSCPTPQARSVVGDTSWHSLSSQSGTLPLGKTSWYDVVSIPFIGSSISSVHNGMAIKFKGNGSSSTISFSGNAGGYSWRVIITIDGNENVLYEGDHTGGGSPFTIPTEEKVVIFNAASSSTVGLKIQAYDGAGTENPTITMSGLQYYYYHDSTVPQTTLGNDGLSVIKDNLNFFRAKQNGSYMETTIKGLVDIPGVLWAGEIAIGGSGYSNPSFKNANVTLTNNGTTPSDTSLYNFKYTGISGTPIIIATPRVAADNYGWTAMVESLSTTNKTFSVRIKRDNSKVAAAFHLIIFGTT